MVLEIADVIGPSVGEQALELGPDPFVGVELRRVRGKALDCEPCSLALDFLNQRSPVGDAPVPDDCAVPGNLLEQSARVTGDIRPADVRARETVAKRQALSDRAHRDGGDGVYA